MKKTIYFLIAFFICIIINAEDRGLNIFRFDLPNSDINFGKYYALVTIDIPDNCTGEFYYEGYDERKIPEARIILKKNLKSIHENKYDDESGEYVNKTISKWGVLVENNKIFTQDVDITYYGQHTVNAMLLILQYEDGTYESAFLVSGFNVNSKSIPVIFFYGKPFIKVK
jgi:hypothetical protein